MKRLSECEKGYRRWITPRSKAKQITVSIKDVHLQQKKPARIRAGESKLKQNKGKNENDNRNNVNAGSAGVACQKSDKRDDE